MLKLNRKFESGFTLVELLISITISALLVLGMASMTKVLQDSFSANESTNEMEQSVYLGMNLLTRELREASSLDSGSNASSLIFNDIVGNRIIYRLNSVNGTLTRAVGVEPPAIVANGIDFTVKNGLSASYFKYDAADIDDVRLITIRLKAIVQGRELAIENSVAPRNL